MQSDCPTVTILIDTFNQQDFIAQAIDSVLAQDWLVGRDDWEILVVDDGSTDDTSAIVGRYPTKVRHLRKPNGGQASAFNHGLESARGEIVMFLDGDDWWHPAKMTQVMAAFAANPDCDAVGHGITTVDELTGRTTDTRPEALVRLSLFDEGGPLAFHRYMSFMGTSRLAARRSALARIGAAPEPLTYEADEYFFTLLPAYGRVAILPECLTFYRLHGQNLYQSSEGLTMDAVSAAKVRKRAQIFACLTETLTVALAGAGLTPQRAALVLEPLSIAARRLALETDGGRRGETVRTELASMRHVAAHQAAGSPIVRAVTLTLAVLLPPRLFYAIRKRYSFWLNGRRVAQPAQS